VGEYFVTVTVGHSQNSACLEQPASNGDVLIGGKENKNLS
jgi:hypothetical protein